MYCCSDDGWDTTVEAHTEYASILRWMLHDPLVLVKHYREVIDARRPPWE